MTSYRCVASGTFASGLTWSFSQKFESASAISVVQGDWFAQLNSFWTNGTHGLETIYPTGTSMTLSSTAQLSALGREGLKQSATMTLPGTSTDDSMPEQDVILVSTRGASVGKSQRGRIHLPAPVETVATGGEMDTTPSTRVSTAIGALYAGMRLAGHDPFIWNVTATVHDPVAFTRKSIVTEEVDRVIRTLRQRSRSRRAVYV